MTSFHEGSPNVIKEAMACNCPIISTNVGDVQEILKGVEGCYICSFNEWEVAKRIENLFEYVEKEKRTKGREKIIHLGLNENDVAEKIVGIYKKLLKDIN